MEMKNLIQLEINENIATLTFNTPDNLNALDDEMASAFSKTLKKIRSEKNIRVLILTGAGRAFSSGGNLGMIESRMKKKPSTNQAELKKFYKTFLAIRDLQVPVIAAINGAAIGAGFCLSLACDLRYASVNAKLGANFAKIGLAPGMGGTYIITQLAGMTRASEILLLAENFSASQAYEMGLLNGVTEPEKLMDTVMEKARVIAGNGPLPVKMIKKGIQKALTSSLEKMFEYDSAAQAKCFLTKDIKEGVKAIREKRPAVFSGR